MIRLSPAVTKYFWGDNLDELSFEKHKKYIIETLLNKGDGSAVEWLFEHIDRSSLASSLDSLKLEPKSANFWKIYLSE